jgi:hypothetical protein
VKIDIPTKRLVSQRPMLLGGAKSSNPVPEDPSILKVIKEMAGPVAKLRDQPAGAWVVGCAFEGRGALKLASFPHTQLGAKAAF